MHFQKSSPNDPTKTTVTRMKNMARAYQCQRLQLEKRKNPFIFPRSSNYSNPVYISVWEKNITIKYIKSPKCLSSGLGQLFLFHKTDNDTFYKMEWVPASFWCDNGTKPAGTFQKWNGNLLFYSNAANGSVERSKLYVHLSEQWQFLKQRKQIY